MADGLSIVLSAGRPRTLRITQRPRSECVASARPNGRCGNVMTGFSAVRGEVDDVALDVSRKKLIKMFRNSRIMWGRKKENERLPVGNR